MSHQDNLSAVLEEFTQTLIRHFPIQGILDDSLRRIVDLLSIDAAGVSLFSPTTYPCLTAAFERGRPVLVANLAQDQRFPQFAAHARREGPVGNRDGQS